MSKPPTKLAPTPMLPPDLDLSDDEDTTPAPAAASRSYRPPEPSEFGKCQHPRTMQRGVCQRDAVGIFPIPHDYVPPRRHAHQPDIPRPESPLCRQHRYMVEDFAKNGKRTVRAHFHEAHCDVCRHPDCEFVETQWVNWRMGTDEACRTLDVSHRIWYNHVDHFDLMAKKMRRDQRKRMLVEMIEKGIRGGGHNARTALTAAAQLAREEGDQPAEKTEHTMFGVVGHLDLTKLSNAELAHQLRKLAAQVESEPSTATAGRSALASGLGSPTIDLPRSAVRVRSGDGYDNGDKE